MAGLGDDCRPDDHPWITSIYAEPNYGSSKPSAPLPPWLRSVLIGPSTAYYTFQEAVADLNDWGLLVNVERYQEADNHIMSAHAKIDIYD